MLRNWAASPSNEWKRAMKTQSIGRYEAAIIGMAGAGSILAGAGLVEIAAHLSPALALGGAICGASGPVAMAERMFAETAHCWGCPAALVGSAMLIGALATALVRTEGGERAARGDLPNGTACC